MPVLNADFIYRSEDIHDDDILDLYVESEVDKENLSHLMTQSPVLLVGSRGTGKTMLLKVATKKMELNFKETRILPILVSFNKAALVLQANYFRQWMLSKTLFALKRRLVKTVGISPDTHIFERYFNINFSSDNDLMSRLDQLINILENSWNKSDLNINVEINNLLGMNFTSNNVLNEMDYFKALIEDICETYNIKRMVFLFDEACHNFIPSQQREFFTLFRDMRSPYISCKAAVYPGITSYGDTFQKFHDATICKIERDITDLDYKNLMREMVKNQVPKQTYEIFEKNGNNFDALIYACSGNPRLLFKSLIVASKNSKSLQTKDVMNTFKTFFRTDIWNEHTKLSEKYRGHKELIDWGRSFIENRVLKETYHKNETRRQNNLKQRTLYFAIHRDAPESVKAAIRILEYSGIVSLHTEGTKVRTEVFDRYQLNLGIVLADERNPIEACMEIVTGLSVKLYSDYGMSSPAYDKLSDITFHEINPNFKKILNTVMDQSINQLDITFFQRETLEKAGFTSLRDILSGSEIDLQTAYGIGPKKSRRIYNTAVNATLEYISG